MAKEYSDFGHLPIGQATDEITEGCIVLEGGAFRGLYGQGVTDCLKQAGIMMQCTIGVSAGAMDGLNYVSGQIGRSVRVNMTYRHDHRYVGAAAFRKNKGIIGFDYLFGPIAEKNYPFDKERFNNPAKRFVAVATDYVTGKTKYFEKDNCSDIYKAVQASASMPYITRPVEVDGRHYLDGGCSNAIPYQWAIDQGYDKIILVRTRPLDFRKSEADNKPGMAKKFYRYTPDFAQVLSESVDRYNRQCQEIEELKASGRIFVIAPSQPVTVSRIEKDLEKLGDLYHLGYKDTENQLEALRVYLKK